MTENIKNDNKNKPLFSGKVAFTPAYYLIDLLISEYVAWQQKQGEDVEINVGN